MILKNGFYFDIKDSLNIKRIFKYLDIKIFKHFFK